MASISHSVTGITVQSITAADPGVLSATTHGFSTGDVVLHEAMVLPMRSSVTSMRWTFLSAAGKPTRGASAYWRTSRRCWMTMRPLKAMSQY